MTSETPPAWQSAPMPAQVRSRGGMIAGRRKLTGPLIVDDYVIEDPERVTIEGYDGSNVASVPLEAAASELKAQSESIVLDNRAMHFWRERLGLKVTDLTRITGIPYQRLYNSAPTRGELSVLADVLERERERQYRVFYNVAERYFDVIPAGGAEGSASVDDNEAKWAEAERWADLRDTARFLRSVYLEVPEQPEPTEAGSAVVPGKVVPPAQMRCPYCRHQWRPLKARPRKCPNCQRRFVWPTDPPPPVVTPETVTVEESVP